MLRYTHLGKRLFSSSSKAKVGFCGVGNMGIAMIRNLRKNGFQVQAFDINPVARETIASEGFDVRHSVADLVKDVNFVVTCLPSTEIVE